MKISLKPDNFIYPYFVVSGRARRERIDSFPGVFRFSVDKLLKDLSELEELGIRKILLFGLPDKKDGFGSQAYGEDNIIASAVKEIKRRYPGLLVMTDVCLCAYTDHGHCGVLKSQGHKVTRSQVEIDGGKTLKALAQMALSHADSGADYVAPSAMARHQVSAIRKVLDTHGLKDTKIMGYSAKYASNFYGPFRDAADSSPALGDRSAYQLDFSRGAPAMKEIASDIKEGADIVMVKPALAYLDIIKEASIRFRKPLAAYNVSGEYVMVKHGARLGLWDEKKVVFEIITSIKRAGADLVITYHAKDIARWLRGQR